ncbi:methyltransferase domain-containing protein [Candidatus Persebacteraceae bacterium Df01]|jgi:malonyl-CoA O-methyltransferase|uniref:Methyltransferase domain-containing protein n=1 Tax=Candidatus Doriopsillibacter californiensis TaxID=2970740 RepID=A0ABT7QJQ3_9GAMM|nr:methyltransferase domain-containing protein [Candidatus Persebacteraceae bacterium Df01]
MSVATDKAQVRRAFSRAIADDATAVIGERLAERLVCIDINPQWAADIGGDGKALQKHYPTAQVIALDFALPVLHHASGYRVLADAEFLPLQSASLDMLWSNLCFEWADIKQTLKEAARTLKPETGLLIFSTLGPDTLREARAAFAKTEPDAPLRMHTFMDMHDIGDLLVQTGFSEPMLEMEQLTLTYAAAEDALREVHNWGAGCALQTRRRGLTGRRQWQAAMTEYEKLFADEAGRVPATYEIVYAIAWRTAPKETVINFA